MNLCSLIKGIAHSCPKKTAIIEGEQTITYWDLWQRIESLSNIFRSIGIRKNTRVVIILPNCKEFIFSFFAILNLNAIAVPLKLHMTCWELSRIFKNCKPKGLITTYDLIDKLLAVRPSLLKNKLLVIKEGHDFKGILDKNGELEKTVLYTFNDLYEMREQKRGKSPKITSRPKQIASINYTYRGYGYPLGAMLTHNNYIHSAIRYIKLVGIEGDMRILLIMPLSHIFPLVGCLIVPLLAKATIIILERINPKKIFLTIERHKVNVLVCIPTLYEFLLRHYDNHKHDISSLLFGISGAELMSGELYEKIKSELGIDIIQGYGLTETLPVTCNPRWGNRPETIGITGHDVHIKIIDEQGRECKTGETGEILIKCPSVMAGYYREPEETSNAIRSGYFHTGDLGIIDSNNYLYFKGLKKSITKINGITVDLMEIKNILELNRKIHIDEIVIEDIIDHEKQKRKKGIIVRYSDRTKDNVSSNEILKLLSNYISEYKFPKEFIKI
ncbi:MAG: class I adenylate-forming enzyme family protein [bacterium]